MEKRRFTLPENRRINRQRTYSEIFRKGKRLRFPEFTLVFKDNGLPYSRIGISVGKKFGNAVKRNRAKRLCRELFRLYRHAIPEGVDIIFLPGKRLLETPWPRLVETMLTAGRKIEQLSGKKTQAH